MTHKCPRCRTEWIGTPTQDGLRKCRNCAIVWREVNGKRRITWTPERDGAHCVYPGRNPNVS